MKEEATVTADSPEIVITVRRVNTFNGYGVRTPYSWTYEMAEAGPDGYRCEGDSSLSHLRQMLSRRYGTTLVIREEWNEPLLVAWAPIERDEFIAAATGNAGARDEAARLVEQRLAEAAEATRG